MKTRLNLEYTAEDVARLILADMIRKNPVLVNLSNVQYDQTWKTLLGQTSDCQIALPPINQIESDYNVKTGKGLT